MSFVSGKWAILLRYFGRPDGISMTIGHFIAFNLALFAAIVSPGPALLVALQTTLSGGRSAGFAIGFGLGLTAAMWTMAALLGLQAVFRVFPWAYSAGKTLGAAYLVYLAIKMWRGARNPIEPRHKLARYAFIRGISINLLNPKSVLFAAAALIVALPPNMSAAENALVVLNHMLVEFAFYSTLALGMSSKVVSAAYLRAKVYLDRTASVILGGLGVRLLTSR